MMMTLCRCLAWLPRATLVACLWCAAMGWAPVWGMSRARGAEPPLQFRRVYVAQDRIRKWPTGSGAFLPVDRDEFERLVQTVEQAARGAAPLKTARLVEARYTARLDNARLLSGHVELVIENTDSKGTLLSLEPCNLAISAVGWAATPQEAVCGRTAEGQFAALVEKSGTLQADWSLRGQRQADGSTTFVARLPECLSSVIHLEGPGDVRISAADALLTQQTTDQPSRHRWTIELGGRREVVLRVTPRSDDQAHQHPPLVRQQLAYDISRQGMEVVAGFELDVHDEPLHRIELLVDPGLLPLAASYGQQKLPFTTTVDKHHRLRLSIDLKTPLVGTGRQVRLIAAGQPQFDKTWTLPRIRPLGLFWQEGQTTLRIHAPLKIRHVLPRGCQQSEVNVLPAPAAGESIVFQLFDPDATLRLRLGEETDILRVRRATSIVLKPQDSTGQMIADLSIPRGDRFVVEAHVEDPWVIDSIASIPLGAVEDWNVVPSEAGGKRVTIRFAKPIRPGKPTRLVMAGRFLASPTKRPLTGMAIRMVRLLDTAQEASLVSIRADDQYTLRTRGVERLARLEPGSLDPSMAALFTTPPSPLLFQWEHGADELEVFLVAGRPEFTASLHVRTAVSDLQLRQRFSIACRPDAEALDQLIVRFSVAGASPPQWRLVGFREPPRGRRLTPTELDDLGLSTGGETWLITLPKPMASDFELVATRSMPRQREQPIPLISLPRARTQQGELTVEETAASPFDLRNFRLKPQSLEPGDGQTVSAVRARFSYDPATDAEGSLTDAILLVRPDPARMAPSAIVWHQSLQTHVDTTGRARHVATYWLENQGLATLEIDWPRSAKLGSLTVDAAAPPYAWDGQRLKIQLAPRRQYAVIRLAYTSSSHPLSPLGTRRFPLPKLLGAVAVLSRDWVVWLPPGYEATGGGPFWESAHVEEAGLPVRWFGPLGRPRSASPLNPLKLRDWTRLVDRVGQSSAARQNGELIAQFGAAISPRLVSGSTAPLTWRRQLVEFGESLGQTGRTLLIDHYALADAGLQPNQPLKPLTSTTPYQRGRELLETSKTTLLVAGRLVLWTTAKAAARYGPRTSLDGGLLYQMGDHFSAAWNGPARHSESFEWVRPYAWGVAKAWPWKASLEPARPGEATGWTSWRFVGGHDDTLQVTIMRGGLLRWIGWCGLLALSLLIWRYLRDRLDAVLWLAAVAAVAVLWLPSDYALVASGTLLGCLFCGLILFLRRGVPLPRSVADQGSSGAPRLIPATVLLIALLKIAVAQAADAPNLQNDGDTIARILIPVDDQKQPVGDKYLVPDRFYDALRRLAATATGAAQKWLVEQASYRLELRSSTQAGQPVELAAAYDLRLFAPAIPLHIPFGKSAAETSLIEARLDGRRIPATWNQDGLLLSVDEPGVHQLELRLRPKVTSRGEGGTLELAIPAVARAKLEVDLPDKPLTVAVPQALGSTSVAKDRRSVRVQLGPTSRLVVNWTPDQDQVGSDQPLEVEQYYWLRVKSGAVVIDAEYRFAALQGQLRQFELAMDPRLRVLPIDQPAGSAVDVETVAGEPQIVRFRFAQPLAGDARLRVSMLLTNTSGVGKIRFPHIEPRHARSTRRWLALLVDPVFQARVTADDTIEELSTKEFLRAWGNADEPPQSAFRLANNESGWELSTSLKAPRKLARQQLALNVSRNAIDVRFAATVRPVAGSIFQHRLRLPAEMTVEHVSVLEEDVERAANWFRDEDGRLTIFLASRAIKPQRVEVRGRMPGSHVGPFRFPALGILDSELESTEIAMAREPSVLIRFVKTRGLEPFSGDAPWAGWPHSRVVAQYRVSKPAFELSAIIEPNAPHSRAVQITTLQRTDDGWEANIDLRLQVDRGVVDVLHFDVPASWTGPFKVTPAAETRLIHLPGQPRGQLVVRPAAAMDGAVNLVIRAPLVVDPRQRLRVPHVVPLEVDSVKQFVILPAQHGLEQMAWDTRGLRSREVLPQPPPKLLSAPGAFVAYEVVAGRFEATLRSVERATGHAQVWLADVRVAWTEDGHCHGVATFDLDPAGMLKCPLKMPQGQRLAQVMVNGSPALATQTADGRWLISLGPGDLPQFVEVVFVGSVTPGRQVRFDAPSLGDLPVERTFWTIHGPPCLERLDAPSDSVSPLAVETLALNSIAELAAYGAELTPESEEELAKWYAAWSKRLRSSLARVTKLLPTGTKRERQNALADIEAIRKDQSRFAERLGVALMGESAPPGLNAVDLWTAETTFQGPSIRRRSQGSQSKITIHVLTPLRERFAGQIWVTLAILAFAGAASTRAFKTLCKQWPHALGVVVGLLGWLWLWPSVQGMLLVAISLFFAVGISWRKPSGHVMRRPVSDSARAGISA